MDTYTPSRPALSTSAGLLLTVVSAALLSVTAVLTQLAYTHGATVGALLTGRFLVAAAVLWPVIWMLRHRLRATTRRQVGAGLCLGVGFSLHAYLFSASLAKLDAALVDLLVFTYPALVTVGAVVLRRDRWSARRGVALLLATAGSSLVLLGGFGSLDPVGAALALGAALAYAGYILGAADQVATSDPLVLIALVTTGAALTLGLGAVVAGETLVGTPATALGCIGLVGLAAVAGMLCFVAGVGALGPSRASIISAVQPALTPVLGYVAFADTLATGQLAGGALVISGVVVLEARGRRIRLLPVRTLALAYAERRRMSRLATTRLVSSGARLIDQGTLANEFFVIVRGSAEVIEDGRPIGELGQGDFFGEVGLLLGGVRTATVVAATDLMVRVIHGRDFPDALATLPTLARRVERAAGERLARSGRTASAIA